MRVDDNLVLERLRIFKYMNVMTLSIVMSNNRLENNKDGPQVEDVAFGSTIRSA